MEARRHRQLEPCGRRRASFFYADPSYRAFYQAHKDRPAVVYVSTNDGSLRAFDGATGAERWALYPNFVLPLLKDTADPSYCHMFLMDGSPTVIDAYVEADGAAAAWRTILVVGGGRRGGYLALDVTDPGSVASPNPPVVLWQWPNPADLSDPAAATVLAEADLGQPRNKATMGFRRQDDTNPFPSTSSRWRAIIGSGPESPDGEARVFDVSLDDGTTNQTWHEDSSDETDNWTTQVTLVDRNGDNRWDTYYYGDQKGSIWRRNVGSGGGGRQLLFREPDGRPISDRPLASFYSDVPQDPNILLFFGTGRLENQADKVDTSLQRLYALRDPSTTNLGDSQTAVIPDLTNMHDMTDPDSGVTDFTGDGWYIDLKFDALGEPSSTGTSGGARTLDSPILLSGVLFQTVFTPTSDPCDFGGKARLLALDLRTGNAPGDPVMDVNGDGAVNASDVKDDGAGGAFVPRALDIGVGMPARPVVDHVNQTLLIQTSDTVLHPIEITTGGGQIDVERWSVQSAR